MPYLINSPSYSSLSDSENQMRMLRQKKKADLIIQYYTSGDSELLSVQLFCYNHSLPSMQKYN